MLDQQFSISLLTMVFLQFRLFVRVCYVCNLGSHYKKLSNRVIKCVFVGYSPKCVIKKKKKISPKFYDPIMVGNVNECWTLCRYSILFH